MTMQHASMWLLFTVPSYYIHVLAIHATGTCSLKHERTSKKPQYSIIHNSNTDLGSNSNPLILK